MVVGKKKKRKDCRLYTNTVALWSEIRGCNSPREEFLTIDSTPSDSFLIHFQKMVKTRMYFSRTGTACCSGCRGGGRGWLRRVSTRGVCSGGVSAQGRSVCPRVSTPVHAWIHPPPCERNHRCLCFPQLLLRTVITEWHPYRLSFTCRPPSPPEMF